MQEMCCTRRRMSVTIVIIAYLVVTLLSLKTTVRAPGVTMTSFYLGLYNSYSHLVGAILWLQQCNVVKLRMLIPLLCMELYTSQNTRCADKKFKISAFEPTLCSIIMYTSNMVACFLRSRPHCTSRKHVPPRTRIRR